MSAQQDLFDFNIADLPHINIVSTSITPAADLIFKESNINNKPLERLNEIIIAFAVEGQIKSNYEGFKEPIISTPQTSCFLYAPFENEHCIPGGQRFDSFLLGLKKDFFYTLLNDAGAPWMETLVRNIEKQLPFNVTPPALPISLPDQLLIQQIRNQQDYSGLKKLYLQSKVSELLFNYFNQVHNLTTPIQHMALNKTDLIKLQELKQYLEKHFLEEHSLEGLARLCGLNIFKLKKGFKLVHGTSVFEYIRHLRMEYASALLRDTQLNVGEVALQVGYSHLNHFSTAFKKHFGLPPKHWKN